MSTHIISQDINDSPTHSGMAHVVLTSPRLVAVTTHSPPPLRLRLGPLDHSLPNPEIPGTSPLKLSSQRQAPNGQVEVEHNGCCADMVLGRKQESLRLRTCLHLPLEYGHRLPESRSSESGSTLTLRATSRRSQKLPKRTPDST
ncbi:hypothetical protein D9611_014850 [Ephemerocybe angulata]|uniref:Uncharacterized protein n=1 Tax=Ephemerocybe angulata TaxID=980116 RepID=A0A8H5EQP9_9AGAR|nr:hypothetical protein D9611_014850 [Tulosesus angulatus]